MSRAQLLQLAKQGNTEAISTLLNQCLKVRRVILIEANLSENCLELKLVSPKVPNQYKLIPFLRDEISSLGIDLFKTVQIYALTDLKSAPAWETSITLEQDWSTAQNLEDAVVKGKRLINEDSEDVDSADVDTSDENLEDLVEQTTVIEDNSPIIEIVEEITQKPSVSFLPLALSFVIGLLTGLSIGYFLSPQKANLPEPTTYTIPEQ
jgi:hypothetical protein